MNPGRGPPQTTHGALGGASGSRARRETAIIAQASSWISVALRGGAPLGRYLALAIQSRAISSDLAGELAANRPVHPLAHPSGLDHFAQRRMRLAHPRLLFQQRSEEHTSELQSRGQL